MTSTGERFRPAAAVADAVVYEGYVLYPYRASALKNRLRWQFGVLAPPRWVTADPSERSVARTELVVWLGHEAAVHVRVRLLHVQRRSVEQARPDGTWQEVPVLVTAGGAVEGWDEAVEAVVDLPPLVAGSRAAVEVPVGLDASTSVEIVPGDRGTPIGRVVRRREEVHGEARASLERLDDASGLALLRVAVENTTTWYADRAHRDEMARHALVAVHVMAAVDGGTFVSSLTPPPEAKELVGTCRNEGLFPVLIGAEGADDLVLASPIILYDHPAVAPESPGDLYDATEIDEILSLRVLTLTPEEKAQARALDPRAAAIVDRCDRLSPGTWADLHGTVRSLRPLPADPRADQAEPGDDTIEIAGVPVRTGSKVVLRPSHRADAQDLFVAGRTASVAGVHRDVNGADVLVAVTLDDDPATELLQLHGRSLYFHPDEVEPLVAP